MMMTVRGYFAVSLLILSDIIIVMYTLRYHVFCMFEIKPQPLPEIL